MAKATARQSKAIVELAASMKARAAQVQAKRIARPRELKIKIPPMDATPERLAKEPDASMIEVKDEKNAAGSIVVRRFRSTHLDRLHKNGKLTLQQWQAGEWYRNKHDEGHPSPRVTAQYGHHVPGGEPSYGLARTEYQLRCRQDWLAARSCWTRDQQGFMDRFLVRDELPRYGGRKAMRNIAFIRDALEEMRDYLRY
ncbi:hypothetical protein [Sphingobium cupriresistens]|nr:hypothetical protein [Sphingobium cupriresistens]